MTTPYETMHSLRVGDVELQYAESGTGEPLLLVHAGVFADWFTPLVHSMALARFRVIRVRRAGYGGVPPAQPISIREHARHLAVLLSSLDIDKVHLAGHSSGALISLQFAADHSAMLQSLALIEPAPLGPFQVPAFAELGQRFLGPAMAAFASGDVGGATDLFLRGVGGEHYREVLDRQLDPHALARLQQEASYFFADEVPSCVQWQFGPDDAAPVQQPVLIVEGAAGREEGPLSQQVTEAAVRLFPRAEVAFIEEANHLVPLQQPYALGRVLAEFAGRHRLR
jgi:pimeloyl-ACP methyl ester carboxylesterase